MASPRTVAKKKAIKKSRAANRLKEKAKKLAETVLTVGTEIALDVALHAITKRLPPGAHYADDMTDPSRKLN